MNCEHKKSLLTEVLWDYDWVLFEECLDCKRKINRFTKEEIETYKQFPEYWLTYQFNKKWELVSYSIYKASWLNINDDLSLIENQLWWNRWIDWMQEVHCSPLKSLSNQHIENILKNVNNIKPEYREYFIKRMEWKL